MKKRYYCKSLVTGKKVKTKHINFYYASTGCFRFGFKINFYKMHGVLAIRLVNLNYTSKTFLPITHYKEAIQQMKEYVDKKFGGSIK